MERSHATTRRKQMNRYLIKYILPMFVTVLSTMTPLFRVSMIKALNELQEQADKTPNPIDNIVVMMLLDILDIPNIACTYED